MSMLEIYHYRFHDPKTFGVILVSFKFLVKNDILTGKQIGRGQEIVLIGFFLIVLFFEITFEFFKIFIEHVFAAKFIPSSEMIYSHSREHSVFLEDPVDLLFIAPHHIPVVIVSLFPFAID